MERIVIISNPIPESNKSSQISLNKLLQLVEPMCESTYIISGNLKELEHNNSTKVLSTTRKKHKIKILNIILYLFFQIKCFLSALNVITKDSIVLFWIADSMPLCMIAAKLKGARTYYFVYGNINKIDSSSAGKLTSYFIKKMSGSADYVCAENIEVFKEWNGVFDEKKKRIIYLYSDVIHEPLNGRSCVLGMVCRVSRGKHVEETIKAFASIHRDYPEYSFEIIGNGDRFDYCRKLIHELDAMKYIKMYGWISHDKLIDIVQTWRASILPSDSEGLPNTLLECMGVGTPCLATPVGAIRDIIIDGENGWLLEGTNEEKIRCGINRIITETNISSVALKAYDTILKRYSLEAARDNVAKELERVD